MLIDVTSNDAGLYICSILKNSSDTSYQLQWAPELYANLKVKSRPGEIRKACHLARFKNFLRKLLPRMYKDTEIMFN